MEQPEALRTQPSYEDEALQKNASSTNSAMHDSTSSLKGQHGKDKAHGLQTQR